ncbi:hypothetical protein K470DRAFT_210359 [Piedraia hortae CBS 480.64]|uniref:Coenzyme Q-binding protein COQ10 START domain-containing protein n=1 Tax=Piedraia hortae CBS 480.64 TaxID=1314780 RepID=A0A6A7C9C6_9PEZI|nr:hypothetical protein K470DRAFT_210359 [Piedraia hortae CBS 480.64]
MRALKRPVQSFQPSRSFLTPPSFSKGLQTISTSRLLRFPPELIYDVISDVEKYRLFLPYCLESTVTKVSRPAKATGKSYPEEARLRVGFDGGLSEDFWSRIYCVPGKSVEAVSGNAEAKQRKEVEHHSVRAQDGRDPSRSTSVLSHLWTQWTVKAQPPGMTKVGLDIEYEFSNPFYTMICASAAPKVADKMIEAFEKRVHALNIP